MALKWYKEGRIDKIIRYCRKDVEVTRDLFRFDLEAYAPNVAGWP